MDLQGETRTESQFEKLSIEKSGEGDKHHHHTSSGGSNGSGSCFSADKGLPYYSEFAMNTFNNQNIQSHSQTILNVDPQDELFTNNSPDNEFVMKTLSSQFINAFQTDSPPPSKPPGLQ